ncbi:60S ribosomal protein L24-like [Vulpes lagopus]|uniref:60S ribosomal protein L24-like n=1 Tax=Vulpes lagopus TaxID=494514 RepID=UPI001BC98191|nr:60S ribosomal protein L24-like [Vulpes lagopus]
MSCKLGFGKAPTNRQSSGWCRPASPVLCPDSPELHEWVHADRVPCTASGNVLHVVMPFSLSTERIATKETQITPGLGQLPPEQSPPPAHNVSLDGMKGETLGGIRCESAFLSKRNPRQINWTVLYRRKHKKGQLEEIQKKRTRRAVKFQRAITGASLADIMAKRNQKPEVRKAQREQAIRAAKEAKKAKQASKKIAMAAAKAPTKAAPKQKIVKPVKVSAPRVGGKR